MQVVVAVETSDGRDGKPIRAGGRERDSPPDRRLVTNSHAIAVVKFGRPPCDQIYATCPCYPRHLARAVLNVGRRFVYAPSGRGKRVLRNDRIARPGDADVVERHESAQHLPCNDKLRGVVVRRHVERHGVGFHEHAGRDGADLVAAQRKQKAPAAAARTVTCRRCRRACQRVGAGLRERHLLADLREVVDVEDAATVRCRVQPSSAVPRLLQNDAIHAVRGNILPAAEIRIRLVATRAERRHLEARVADGHGTLARLDPVHVEIVHHPHDVPRDRCPLIVAPVFHDAVSHAKVDRAH